MSSTNVLSTLCIKDFSKQIHQNVVYAKKMETPLGEMVAIADDQFLYTLGFENRIIRNIQQSLKELDADLILGSSKVLKLLELELEDYFAGKLKRFTVPLKCFGTDFQKQSWEQLTKIEYGETTSYGNLAIQLGRSVKHARAVGNAAGANPIIIIVPCHRLTASSQNIGGFGSGIDKKVWLLQHEAKFKDQ